MNRNTPAMDATVRQPAPPTTEQIQQVHQQPASAAPQTAKTPQEFYAEMTRRPDIRAILAELADR